MDKEEERRFVLGLLLALLLARAVRALFSTLFYVSLADLRLGPSAWWMLALLVPALAPLVPRRAFPLLVALAGLATSALVLTRFTPWHVPAAALATAATLVALLRVASIGGALAGLALDGALLALGVSLEPSSLLVPAAFGVGALLLARRAPLPEADAPGWLAGAALGALLALELAFLASPYALSRWLGAPAWLFAAAGGLGLLVGATRLRHAGPWIWIVGALALVDLALARSPLAPLSLALVQCAIGCAGARLSPRLPSWSGSLAFAATLAPLSFLLLYFRSPLGWSEWSLLVPLLAGLAVAPALLLPRPGRVRARAGATAAALLLGASAIAAALPAPIDAPAEDGTLTVVTWNVHQAFGNRGALDPAIYAAVLRDVDADIILLQESDTARLSSGHVDIVQWLARDLRMHAAYGDSGTSVLSRYPFTDDERPPDADWTFEVGVDVDGTTVWVHSVHLAIGWLGNRSAQIDMLLRDEHHAPHIVGGDLNTCATCGFMFGRAANATRNESSPDYDRIMTRYTDAWVAAGHAADDPSGVTFRLPAPTRRFDHILVEGLDTLDARALDDARTRAASDHLPTVATFRLP